VCGGGGGGGAIGCFWICSYREDPVAMQMRNGPDPLSGPGTSYFEIVSLIMNFHY
jgi:hypothetical protein